MLIITTLVWTNRISFANVYFVEFEQVNVYLRKFDIWSLKLFDPFILIYCNCVRGDDSFFHEVFV